MRAVLCAVLLLAVVSGCSAEQPETLRVSDLTPPQLPVLSEDEVEAQAAIDLERITGDLLRAAPDATVPEVERVRFIEPDEWADTIADCVRSEGFEVEVDSGAVRATGDGDSSQERYQLALFTCNARFPVHPRFTVPLGPDQLRYLYDYFTHVAKPCVEAQGFDVDDVPGLDRFVRDYGTAGGWNVYAHAAEQTSEQQWNSLNEMCPQTPPRLYG